jgi:hypothetical protein
MCSPLTPVGATSNDRKAQGIKQIPVLNESVERNLCAERPITRAGLCVRQAPSLGGEPKDRKIHRFDAVSGKLLSDFSTSPAVHRRRNLFPIACIFTFITSKSDSVENFQFDRALSRHGSSDDSVMCGGPAGLCRGVRLVSPHQDAQGNSEA